MSGTDGEATATRPISPASKRVAKGVREAMDALPAARAAKFKSMAPTALHLSADQADIFFASTWIPGGTHAQTVQHELELQRLAAYLATHARLEWVFAHQAWPGLVTTEGDPDGAGDVATRRWRGGGFEFTPDAWAAQNQQHRLPSGEAECFVLVNGIAR